jgi:hypothetical protein
LTGARDAHPGRIARAAASAISVENRGDLLPAVDAGFPLPSRDDDRVEMPASDEARAAVWTRLRDRGVPATRRATRRFSCQ